MARDYSHARAMRQEAEKIIQGLVEAGEVLASEQNDYVNSLVHQWNDYAGHATLLLGDLQVYFHFGRNPLGRPHAVPDPDSAGWLDHMMQDWKVSPEYRPEIVEQLNHCQCAVVTNEEGVPLEFYVDPQERSQGVRPPEKKKLPAGWKRDYRDLAAKVVQRGLGPGLDPEELEALSCSVAKQWDRFGGHAGLLLGNRRVQIFHVVEDGRGGCNVHTPVGTTQAESDLASYGFPPDVIPDVLVRFNLAQEIEFRDRDGARLFLWYDAKENRVRHRPAEKIPRPRQASSPPRRINSPPAFCPRCSAVLKMWRPGDTEQQCPQCRHTISLV